MSISGGRKRGYSAMSLEGESSIVKKRRTSTSPRYSSNNCECVWEGGRRRVMLSVYNIYTNVHYSMNVFNTTKTQKLHPTMEPLYNRHHWEQIFYPL